MNVNANQPDTWSDEELMKAYQLGDEMAFRVLYQRYSGKVYGYLRSKRQDASDVQEVFQEVFMKLHRMRSKYKTTERFSPWLYAMMRNVLIDQVRKTQSGVSLSFGQELFDTLQADADGGGDRSRVLDFNDVPGFSTLKTRQREVLEMRYRDDRSFSEIAGQLETSEDNVRKLISRAIGKLRKSSLKERTSNG